MKKAVIDRINFYIYFEKREIHALFIQWETLSQKNNQVKKVMV